MNCNLQEFNFERDRSIISILGEICWGLRVTEFEKKIGVKKEVVECFVERLLNEEKKGLTETFLNPEEVSIIKKALAVVEIEIEEWEFQTRISETLEYVKSLPLFKIN